MTAGSRCLQQGQDRRHCLDLHTLHHWKMTFVQAPNEFQHHQI